MLHFSFTNRKYIAVQGLALVGTGLAIESQGLCLYACKATTTTTNNASMLRIVTGNAAYR